MREEDFYSILGVEKDADASTIRQAFKKLALTHHPDKVCESERAEAEIRFKVISEAYEVLSNEESRMLYDAQGQFGDSADWQDFYAAPQDDFFGFGSSSYGSRFDSQFYTQASPPPSSKRTDDVVFEVELTLENVYKGNMLKLSSQRQVLCRRCHGTGGRQNAKKRACSSCKGMGTTKRTQMVGPGLVATSTVLCPICNGEGQVFRDKDLCRRCKGKRTHEVKTIIEVYVPKGVKNRHRIIIEGHSDEEPGKVAGDLVILVLVNPDHPTFRREGNDLYATAQISLKEALTGFSRPLITHLDGRQLKPTVARGEVLSPGSILRIPGEGLITEDASAGTEVIGDLYLQMDVVFPNIIDKHILDKMATLLTDEDDNDSDRSDDTLDETGYAKEFDADTSAAGDTTSSGHNFNSAKTFSDWVDVEHDILNEADLPEYKDDANDEPEPESSKDSSSADDYGNWRSNRYAHNGATPGCATM